MTKPLKQVSRSIGWFPLCAIGLPARRAARQRGARDHAGEPVGAWGRARAGDRRGRGAAGRRPAPSHVSQGWGGPRVAHIRIREPVPRVDPTRDEFEGLYFRACRGLVRIARTGTYAAFHIRPAWD